MKRVFAIILIGALMLSLCACRRADPPEETAVAEGAAGKSRVEHREDGSVYLIGEDGTETYLGRRQAEQQNLPAEDAPQQNPPAVQQEEPAAPASLPENRIITEMEAAGKLRLIEYEDRRLLWADTDFSFSLAITDEKLEYAVVYDTPDYLNAFSLNQFDRRYNNEPVTIVEGSFQPVHGTSEIIHSKAYGDPAEIPVDYMTNTIYTVRQTYYRFSVSNVLKGDLGIQEIDIAIEGVGVNQRPDGKYSNMGYLDFSKRNSEECHYILALYGPYQNEQFQNYFVVRQGYCFAAPPAGSGEQQLLNLFLQKE